MTGSHPPHNDQPRLAQGAGGALWRSPHRDRPPSRLRLVVLLLMVGALAALILGRSLWLPVVGRFLVVADPLQPADALVPLAGEQERAIYAARLFGEGYAHWFVATSLPLKAPGIRSSYGELVRQEAIWQGVPEERIVVVPGIVETTYQEAMAVRGLAQERGWRSLVVVTTPYHTRRARMAFQDALRGTGINVVVRPVNESWYRAESWWQTQLAIRVTWTEYVALILYLVGYR